MASGVALRFAQFYAPEAAHTIAFNTTVRRRLNPFVGAPEAYSSFIHAEDAGAAVVAALQAPSGIYNVADDEPVTREEAGRIVAEALGVKPPHAPPEGGAGRHPGRRASCSCAPCGCRTSRFKDATGWAPQHPSIRGAWPAEAAS